MGEMRLMDDLTLLEMIQVAQPIIKMHEYEWLLRMYEDKYFCSIYTRGVITANKDGVWVPYNDGIRQFNSFKSIEDTPEQAFCASYKEFLKGHKQ